MQEIISAFRQFFTREPGQIAVLDHLQKRNFTYAEMESLSSRLAAVLRPMVQPGARVSFLLGNDIEIALCYLACMQLQVTAVPVNIGLHVEEIAQTLAFAGPELVITNSALKVKLPEGTRCVLFGKGAEDTYSVDTLPEARLAPECFGALHSDYLALIMFTSGSTGVPKAIPVLFSCLMGHVVALMGTSLFGTRGRYYNVLPMSYIGGIQLLLCYFSSGSVFILDEAFSARSSYRYWETVLARQAETLWLTPTMASALLAIGLEEVATRPLIAAQVKRVVIAMGPIATDVKRRFEQVFGVMLQKSFGITETLLCCHWNDRMGTPVESVGRPLPGVEVILVDGDEQRVASGKEGEIRVGGKWVLPEYWNQPEITAMSFDANGYFKTGDLGRIDAEGNVFITGRIKDMIKCGGLNVAPVEIEATLARLESVKEAAVVGVPDEFYGERIIAFVTVQPGKVLVPEDAIAFCRQHLTAQKVPAELRVRQAFPMNVVGKIDKRALKAELALEMGKGAA